MAEQAVKEAAAHPLRVTSAEAAPYRESYTSISGAKFVDRNGILNAYHAAAAERDAAQAAMKTADKELETAEQGRRAQKDQSASVARTDAKLEYEARVPAGSPTIRTIWRATSCGSASGRRLIAASVAERSPGPPWDDARGARPTLAAITDRRCRPPTAPAAGASPPARPTT